MATATLGTAGTATLTSLLISNAMADADVATIIGLLKGDSGQSTSPIGSGYLMPGSFSHNGILFVPGRGMLVSQPGDRVCVGPLSGWPILISAAAAATGDYVHN